MSISILLLALGSGLMAGVFAGLFGVGGGTLVVPMLMLQGAGIHQAVAMSLVYILFASFSGSVAYARQGLLEPGTVATMALSASLSVFAGVKLSGQLGQRHLALLFAAFIVLVLGMFAWKQKKGVKQLTGTLRPVSEQKRRLSLVLTGLLAGLIASLLGVGGGLVMVPLLVLLCSIELKQATAISLAVVCLIALIGVLQHALFGQLYAGLEQLGLNLVLMSVAGMAGAPLGVRLNQKLPEVALRTGFIALCLSVMGYMLYSAWH